MKGSVALSKRARLVTALLSLVCLALFALSFGLRSSLTQNTTAQAPRQTELPQQSPNRTESLQIIDFQKSEDSLTLQMRNTSGKEINGYTLATNDGGTITTDYTVSGRVIAPGEVIEQLVPTGTLTDVEPQKIVSVVAVVFADDSSEGDPNGTAYIKNRRIGIKTQLARVVPILKNKTNSSDSDVSAALNDLESELKALPETAANGMPAAVGEGLRDAKQDALKIVERLKQKQKEQKSLKLVDFRKELNLKLVEKEKRLARL